MRSVRHWFATEVNNIASRLALNNFTVRNKWDGSEEIVVVIGGSGGMGAVIVRMFGEKNIIVIILDIAPPRTPIPYKKEPCQNL